MQSLSIAAALAIRDQTRANVKALQDKPPTAGQAVAGDATRTSTAPGARALKAGPAGA